MDTQCNTWVMMSNSSLCDRDRTSRNSQTGHVWPQTCRTNELLKRWFCCRMVVAAGFQAGSCSHGLSFRSSLGNVAAFRAQNSSPAAHRGLRQLKVCQQQC